MIRSVQGIVEGGVFDIKTVSKAENRVNTYPSSEELIMDNGLGYCRNLFSYRKRNLLCQSNEVVSLNR